MRDEILEESVMKVIQKRRSTRRFSSAPIKNSDIMKLVEAGIWAPSGSNWQNQRFLLIDDKNEIERLGKQRFVWPYSVDASSSSVQRLHPSGIVGKAAALIVVFSDSLNNDRRRLGEYHIWQNLEIQNCAASIENMLLLATSMKLASCWVSASDEMNYTRMLSNGSWRSLFMDYDIPSHYKLQGIVLLGHPEHIDGEGFPKGEKKHGATIWQSTDRRPIESYLIRKRNPGSVVERSMSRPTLIYLTVLSSVLRLLLKIVRTIDRSIQDVELSHLLRKSD